MPSRSTEPTSVPGPDGQPSFRALSGAGFAGRVPSREGMGTLPGFPCQTTWAAGRLRRPRTIAGGHGNPSWVPMSDDELAALTLVVTEAFDNGTELVRGWRVLSRHLDSQDPLSLP
jgi:hypothetical protein